MIPDLMIRIMRSNQLSYLAINVLNCGAKVAQLLNIATTNLNSSKTVKSNHEGIQSTIHLDWQRL